MKRNLLISGLLSCAALLPASAYAVPAMPGLVKVTQPDGTELSIRLHGDESRHYATTSDGMMLVQAKTGFFEYAVPDAQGLPTASGIKAQPIELREPSQTQWLGQINQKQLVEATMSVPAALKTPTGEPKYIFDTTAFPCSGEPHSLVLLVGYSDVGFSMGDAHDYYDRMLNAKNFRDNGATGSVIKYFKESSDELFRPVFDVYGPVQLDHPRYYYGENDERGNDKQPELMLVDACRKLAEAGEIDFSQYDTNGDGFVDNIFIIYAGKGEASSGIAETVWPHSFELTKAGIDLQYNGVTISKYGCSNELRNDNVPDGIGTFVHEFSHVLGLPDLYNTVNSMDDETPGPWSVMDRGPYNNNSCTPPAYSCFERYSLGWCEPDTLAATGDYTLQDINASNHCYLVPNPKNGREFLMFENRQQQGWDKYIPGHGMLVWHIEFAQQVWNSNTPNNNPGHKRVDIVEADNKYGGYSYEGDPWPGSKKKTEFSRTTRPALLTWSGKDFDISALTDIAETDGVITFSATGSQTGMFQAAAESSGIAVAGRSVTNRGTRTAEVYDLAGRRVATLAQNQSATLPAGIYIAGGCKIAVR